MLKKISVIILVLLISACVTQPAEKGFEAFDAFDKVEAAKTRVSLGITYLKNGSFSQAKSNLDKALEFDPRSGEAHHAMAFYYQQVDETKRAHEYYKRAIELSDDDPDILNTYGTFLCKQGQYEEAKVYFLRAVDDKRYISTAQTYENLAFCAQNQNLFPEAIAYFNSALSHQPTRSSSLLSLTQLYVQTGQWDDAKKSLFKYDRSASVTEESLWLSFQIAQGQNDLKSAIGHADLLKRLYPASENTQSALRTLGKFQPNMAITQKTTEQSTSIAGKQPVTSVITMDDVRASNTPVEVRTQIPIEAQPKPKLKPPSQSIVEQANTDMQEEVKNIAVGDNSESTLGIVNQAVAASEADNIIASNNDDELEQETEFHIVLPKENLYRISLKYNVKMSKLLDWNNLQDASSIKIGTKLRVRDPKLP